MNPDCRQLQPSRLQACCTCVYDECVSTGSIRTEICSPLAGSFPNHSQRSENCALFVGYTSATFTGDAVDDRLLQLVSTNTDLTFLSVNSCHSVTDAGISAAVLASPNLTTLIVRDTSLVETYGHFLGKVLALQNLQKLELRSQMIDLQDASPELPTRTYVPVGMCHDSLFFMLAVAWCHLVELSPCSAVA